MTPALDALATQFWDLQMAAQPLWASVLGDHRFDSELPDLSAEAEATQAAALRDVLRRVDAIDPTQLDAEERVTHAMLRFAAQSELDELASRLAEFTLAPVIVGPHVALLETLPRVTLPEPRHAEALVARYRKIDAYLEQAVGRFREGVAHGRTPVARAVGQVVGQLDEYLASRLDSDPLLLPTAPAAWDSSRAASWRDEVRTSVADVVRPAMQRYRDALEHEVRPHARPPERSGVCWITDGDEVYARSVRGFTSLEIEPAELHEIGLQAIAALAGEYQALGRSVLQTSDLAEIYRRLRDDPELRFATGEDVRGQAEKALARAQAAVPEWFRRLPRTPCVVHEMADYEVKDGTIAYYLPPATDGTRPGGYYVNTYAPETRTRFESEALAFHEAVPGHHLQIAIAQELEDVPEFRRHASVNAYVEGWALYTERLADEMGLYSGALERMGMLSFDSWRAGRLVVDTGLHHLGWSRDHAIAYLSDNSPLARNNIANEVDRYISWPAQALAYKVGQREIFRLRDSAQRALGSRFDIRAFHDTVLAHGAVPLTVLAGIVDEWVAAA